jgi:hypothetical protein
VLQGTNQAEAQQNALLVATRLSHELQFSNPDSVAILQRPVVDEDGRNVRRDAIVFLSNSDEYGEIAKRLDRVFSDFQLEVFEERHHFDPPHRIEPERLADSLRALWRRA